MANTKEIILKLKEIKDEKGLSLNEIVNIVEKNGDCISRSTVQRVFADGSEDVSFRYEETIRPIAKALLEMETIEDDDTLDTQTLKVILQYKIERILELENQIRQLQSTIEKDKKEYHSNLDQEKIKYHEKMDAERERYNKSIDFLKEQVNFKDKRIDILMDSVQKKDALYESLFSKVMACQKCTFNKEEQDETT